jgi:hypothetical protein
VSSGVVSRPQEFRAVAEFLQSAVARPSGLLIEGEAGIGKTTLWLAAVAQARERGFAVISARVGQAESVLAYAAVADLLGDVDPGLFAELPDVQQVAVDRVLLRASSEGPQTDHRVVAAALASSVEQLAARTPVLVATASSPAASASSSPSDANPTPGTRSCGCSSPRRMASTAFASARSVSVGCTR